MRQLIVCLILLLSFLAPETTTATEAATVVANENTLNPKIERRIQRLALPIQAPANDRHLHRKLRDYLNGNQRTEQMLSRASRYFPLFEETLCKYDLPEDLKYLAVVESMLMPHVHSSAGAAGLWQLMPATARSLGLTVNNMVDERMDAELATDAAARMLKELYADFGDWNLVVAAYNCGPGRLRGAMRQAKGQNDYAKIKRFLPEETQNYVSTYVAAAYTLNYYANHGLDQKEHAARAITTVHLFKGASLRKLAKLAGMEYGNLRALNRSLVQNYLPSSKDGFELKIPSHRKETLQTAIWGQNNLVMTQTQEELTEATARAREQGFRAEEWLLGCRSGVVLLEGTNLPWVIEELSGRWLNNYQPIAML
ncbi:lytic transglycosylase domain-containing protein [Neolewinella antarctica]|uniref:Membrane-bound lytic murein transglycosylase D n=1 Tax=Neolewinella antarctica TaxID=442734 RepID=A0ABX0XD05_9BACT|nr:lytic transglycosylase domain-containing protein [Neolewinella antarctica]NJC27136.1 membrane-bound lytic murein transglycosylase D [Neolewinella antarctica]